MPPVSQSSSKTLEVESGISSVISDYEENTHLVDLSQQYLKEIPKEVLELKKLRIVILSNNYLKNADFLKTVFPMLKKIVLNNNNLKSFPKPACLCKLRELILSNNSLEVFPSWLLDDKWYFIEYLDLSYNPLFISIKTIRIPSQDHKMRNIHYLNLSNTEMSPSHLPLLKYFSTLKKLDISSYSIKYSNSFYLIPAEVFPQDLEILIMKNVGLTAFPNLYIPSLVILDLSRNSLSYIPYLLTFNSLKKLILQNCTLCYVPKNLGCYESLVYLDLSHNEIGELPDNISKCTNLKYLDLYNNTLTLYPKQLDELNLEKLDLSLNFHELPVMCGEKTYSDMEKELRQFNNLTRETGPKQYISESEIYEFSSSSSEDFYSETDPPLVNEPVQETVEEVWEVDTYEDVFDPNLTEQEPYIANRKETEEDELQYCVEVCPREILTSEFFYLPGRIRYQKSIYASYKKPAHLQVPPVVRTFTVEEGQFDCA